MIKRFIIVLLCISPCLTMFAWGATDDIARLYNFTPGTIIQSSQVNGEFDQVITTLNNKVGRTVANTLTGNNTFAGTNTFSAGVTTDTITERTTDNGVTIDGLHI